MIRSLLVFYLLGYLVSTTLIVAWFFTSFPLHLTRLVTFGQLEHSTATWGDWLTWVRSHSATAAELLGCPICLGFWISLLVASIVARVNGLTMWFIPSAALSWPALIFGAFKLLSR
jgi:hypothetical protein